MFHLIPCAAKPVMYHKWNELQRKKERNWTLCFPVCVPCVSYHSQEGHRKHSHGLGSLGTTVHNELRCSHRHCNKQPNTALMTLSTISSRGPLTHVIQRWLSGADKRPPFKLNSITPCNSTHQSNQHKMFFTALRECFVNVNTAQHGSNIVRTCENFHYNNIFIHLQFWAGDCIGETKKHAYFSWE